MGNTRRALTIAFLLTGPLIVGIANTAAAHATGVEYGAVTVEHTPLGAQFYGSWSVNSAEEAKQAASAQCGSGTGNLDAVCDLVTWTDGCVAAASRGVDYQWAEGSTRAEAIQNAIARSNAEGATLPVPLPAGLAYSACTPSAG